MMMIPSIDLMAPTAELPIGTLATRTIENGLAFANTVSLFQQSMSETPFAPLPDQAQTVPAQPVSEQSVLEQPVLERPVLTSAANVLPIATPETFKRVFAENVTVSAALPEAKPLTLPEMIVQNRTVAAALPETKPLTLPEVIVQNRTVSAALPEAKPLTLPEVIVQNRTVAAALPETVQSTFAKQPTPEVPIPVASDPATPETLKVVVEEALAQMPKVVPATPETLKVVVEEALAQMPKVVPATPEMLKVVVEETLARMPKAETESPVLQTVPVTVPTQVEAVDRPSEPDASVASVDAGRVSRIATPSGSNVLLAAANAVVDTMMVSPGLMRGEGEVRVMLKPEVLEGTELVIRVGGGTLSVEFLPRTDDMGTLIQRCLPQLEQHLSAKIHTFSVVATVGAVRRRKV